MTYKAFIAHEADTGDSDASHLKASLEKRGIATFVDHEDIPTGEPRDPTIDKALKGCVYFIALGTDAYLISEAVEKEIKRAYALRKKGQVKLILPCRNEGLLKQGDTFLELFPGDQLWEIRYSTPQYLAGQVLNRLKPLEETGAASAPMVDGMAPEAKKLLPIPTEKFLREQGVKLEKGQAAEVIPAVESRLKREKRGVKGAATLLAVACLTEGDRLFHAGEFRQAQGLYQKALENALRTGNRDLRAIAAYELGAAWGRLGYHDEALKRFNNVITLKPDMAAAYNNRGNAYAEKKDPDRAIADFNKAIELDPSYAQAFYNRGVTYAEKKDFERALADYTKAIELDPKDVQAYNNRGVAYAQKEDFAAAIADYTKAIELDPNNALAYYNRGVAYLDKKDFNRAIADYTKAIELDPSYAQAYYNRGVAYADKKDFDRAIADYTKTIQLDPKDATAYYNRACSYSLSGDVDRACADLAKAISLDAKYRVKALTDTDFDKVRDDPRFKAVVEKMKGA